MQNEKINSIKLYMLKNIFFFKESESESSSTESSFAIKMDTLVERFSFSN